MKKNTAAWLIAAAVTLFSNICFSQQNIDSWELQSSAPPSPTVSAIARYGETPVDLHTGTPQVSIPLYEIKLKGTSLPVSLGYNASGIKVEEAASWVGLGWTLNAGGVITRSVQGRRDDESIQGASWYYLGYLSQIENLKKGYDEYKNFEEGFTDTELSTFCGLSDGIDTEPDVFYANFAGMSFKFLFKKIFYPHENKYEVNVITVPDSPVKIEYATGGFENDDQETWIRKFVITTFDGVKYTFDKHEISKGWTRSTDFESSPGNPYPGQPGNDRNHEYISAWHLTSVETPMGETVELTYRPEEVEEYSFLNTTWAREYSESICFVDIPTWTWSWNLAELGPGIKRVLYPCGQGFLTQKTTTYSFNEYFTQKISKIEWKSGGNLLGKIEFDADYDRIDLLSDQTSNTGCKALSNIKISNGLGETVKNYRFAYSNFVSEDINSVHEWYKELGHRLKLESVQEYNGSEALPPYEFKYNAKQLPCRVSPQQDFWGYYNANPEPTLRPTIYCYPYYFNEVLNTYNWVYPLNPEKYKFRSQYDPEEYVPPVLIVDQGGDRRPNKENARACALEKITFPAGGYVKYEYELDKFVNPGQMFDVDVDDDGVVDDNIEGGGIRLARQIVSPNGVDEQVTDYEYTLHDEQGNPTEITSGKLTHLPQHSIIYNEVTDGDGNKRYDNKTFTRSQNGIGSGNSVGYSQVTEIKQGNGRNLYKYSMAGAFNSQRDDYDDETGEYFFEKDCQMNLIRYKGVKPVSDNDFSQEYWVSAQSPMQNAPFHDWSKGKLEEKTVYSESGDTVSRTVFNYKSMFTDYLDAYKYDIYKDFEHEFYVCNKNRPAVFYSYYKYRIWQIKKYLESQTDYVYPQDGSKPLATTTDYTYNIWVGEMESTTTETSEGDTYGKEFMYSYSFTDDISMSMGYNGILNRPVATREYRNGKLVGSSITKYGCHDCSDHPYYPALKGKFLPDAVYALETELPLNDDYVTVSDDFILDSKCRLQLTVDAYDSYGNTAQYTKPATDGTAYSSIWGYSGQYPVATVANAKRSEIYHNNFEEETGIHWGNSRGTWTRDESASSHTGRARLKVQQPDGVEAYRYFKSIYPGAKAGETYRYSCWYYSTGPSAELFIYAPGSGISHNDHACVKGTATGKWVLLEGTVSIPLGKTATELKLRVDNNGGGTVYFDDLRLCPADAQMSTATYTPLVGVTSVTDDSGLTTFYEYDDLGRLKTIKNDDGNVIEQYNYKYANQ